MAILAIQISHFGALNQYRSSFGECACTFIAFGASKGEAQVLLRLFLWLGCFTCLSWSFLEKGINDSLYPSSSPQRLWDWGISFRSLKKALPSACAWTELPRSHQLLSLLKGRHHWILSLFRALATVTWPFKHSPLVTFTRTGKRETLNVLFRF